jgi:5-(carboxyamino)imidazole ribonucleotide synthase
LTPHSLTPIVPPAVVGVLGSGQLGRMFAIAARRMGYRVHTFSPESDSPTGQVADVEVIAPYGDLAAVERFARSVDVVTFEFENVPAETAQTARKFAPVRPDGSVLHVTQHRLREKTFLRLNGFPVAEFRPVNSQAELTAALEQLGYPAVLKTAAFGYDGKGQSMIRTPGEIAAALAPDAAIPRVLESFVDFEIELSVVAARGLDGSFAHFGAIQNSHHHHILDISIAPADVPPSIAAQAVDIARGILESLKVVGVLCVEFFLTRSAKLLVNELAPRPHNSGHLTIDAAVTCQFEQQLRAICGLPLGSTRLHRPAAMANLLGDLWTGSPPDFPAALANENVKLHLYGKSTPRPGRKMGHLTALADTPQAARELVVEARRRLTTRG